MSGINRVIQIGNLTADPDVRFSSSGSAIANFSIANSEKWKDKSSGQMQEKTEYHRIVMFNRLGEIAGEYLKKGSKVYIEGKLQTRKWQDNNGNDRYTTEIVANTMQMLDGKDGVAGGGTLGSVSNQSQSQGGQQQAPEQPPQSNGGGINPEDDIPFASYEKGMSI